MSDRSVTHATFSIERTYDARPTRVFAAWADPVAKARWFIGPDEWESAEPEMDFRVGGRERTSGGPRGGPVFTYDARYQDIVLDQRIVLTYDMYMGETRMSVSLATVEFTPAGSGTRLVYTEHGAYLDGHDTPASREQGTIALLDALGVALQGAGASA